MTDMKKLMSMAIAIISLAVLTVIGILTLEVIKDTNLMSTTGNSTVDSFITGLTYFATFTGILVIGVIGKILIKMYKSDD